MIKLHVFVNSFWNTGTGITGGDKRALEILKRWDRDTELQCKLIVYAPRKFITLLQNEGVNKIEYRITSTSVSESQGCITAYIIHTFKALTKIPYFGKDNHFYSTSDFFPDTLPCLFGKIFNFHSKWVALIHHIIEHYRTRPGNKKTNIISFYAQQISLILIKMFSNKIFLVSPLVKEYLTRRKFKTAKMILVNNGVDVSYIEGVTAKDKRITQYDAIMLARLAPSKGILDLPPIWKKVTEYLPDAKLGIIGSGSKEIVHSLKDACMKNGVENKVDLLGYLDDDTACQYLKKAKIYIYTSREEGWGISIAEAMACGLPVIAFELPVYKYIFPTGIRQISKRNISEMAETVVELLNNTELRTSMAQSGKQYVTQNYDWNTIADYERDAIYRCLLCSK